MQKDASIALIANMDTSYQQDYTYFIQKIKDSKFDAIYLKIAVKYHKDISQFVYDDKITPEQRSARIISLIKQV